MSRTFFKFFGFALFAVLIASCAKDESSSVENFVNDSLKAVNESCMGGEAGCYELVFPVTIVFGDESTVSVDSYEAMKEAFTNWKLNHPDSRVKPLLMLPYDVINQDGEVVTVSSLDDLKAIIIACKGTFDGPGRPGKGGGKPDKGGHGTKPCFKINFPFSLLFPDGTVEEITDLMDLRTTLKSWKENNIGNKEKPVLVFPLNVTLQDGTVQSVLNEEELRLLKEDCKG